MPDLFDTLAVDYDQAFTHTRVAQWLRGRTHQRLERLFPPGSRLLELGCGTGEDARWLAGRGCQVLATDRSPVMLAAARAKTANQPNIELKPLDLTTLPADFPGNFDGVFSNFGALNCLPNWETFAQWLADRVSPGGKLAFAIMGRFCLWETMWHSLHGDFRTASRRWGGQAAFRLPDEPTQQTIYYPTPGYLACVLAPHFERTALLPLGVWLPPSDASGAIERRPQLLAALTAAEERLGDWPLLAPIADHYWIEFRRANR